MKSFSSGITVETTERDTEIIKEQLAKLHQLFIADIERLRGDKITVVKFYT